MRVGVAEEELQDGGSVRGRLPRTLAIAVPLGLAALFVPGTVCLNAVSAYWKLRVPCVPGLVCSVWALVAAVGLLLRAPWGRWSGAALAAALLVASCWSRDTIHPDLRPSALCVGGLGLLLLLPTARSWFRPHQYSTPVASLLPFGVAVALGVTVSIVVAFADAIGHAWSGFGEPVVTGRAGISIWTAHYLVLWCPPALPLVFWLAAIPLLWLRPQRARAATIIIATSGVLLLAHFLSAAEVGRPGTPQWSLGGPERCRAIFGY
jgi:hypothetical protein